MLDNTIKVSIIVPIYNVGQYLSVCLESIVNQTFKSWEAILVDDGSMDNSASIALSFAEKDSRFKYFYKENSGLSSARNYGIVKSNGEYVLFIDSDDYLNDSNALDILYHHILKHSLDILRFEYKSVDEYGEFLYEKDINNKIKYRDKIFSSYTMVNDVIAGEWFAWLYLIKKEILTEIRFNEKCKFQEDIDFYARLFVNDKLKCGYIPNRFYSYRHRSNSITTTIRYSNLEGSFNLCDVFYEGSKKTQCLELACLYRYYAVMMYYWTLSTLSETPYYKQRQIIIEELNLSKLHQRIKDRLANSGCEWYYMPFIKPSPAIGSFLLHYKNKLVSLIGK